jgi:HD-like signal output (HDOD) protein
MKPIAEIEDVIKDLKKLPTLPGIAIKILEAIKDEETGVSEIADILSKDPSLSAEVLKAINSPFYGLPTKITSVSHAANMLGINTVKSLALSFSLVKNFQDKKPNGFDYHSFWKDSLIGATSAKILSEKLLPNFSEDAFFLGLLQNIGILAMNQSMPDQYVLVLQEKERNLKKRKEIFPPLMRPKIRFWVLIICN